MPLFSEHIANMYYGSSSPYTGLPYSYSSSVSPLGSSYSASYLNPGGSYSSHSSLSGYSRAPLSSSRWITSSGRNYAPMLSTISERGSASPVRINSPRRLPLSSRTYGTPTYTPRPLNINTADIDVSRDKYRHKVDPPTPQPQPLPQPKESSSDETENGPFMPRVDGEPETGIDSSPGVPRSTIKRGRTVVRLYTIKRKERDSPRKPTEEQQSTEDTKDQVDHVVENVEEATKKDAKEFMKWREKLSEDLAYKDKKEKKSLGAKLVEKFILKDNEKEVEIPAKVQRKELEISETLPGTPVPNTPGCLDRRCSMELLAEQASLLDSLIRNENLSTATLDLSKMGVEPKNNLETFESLKRRKSNDSHNPLKTTKSDHSLHDSLQSYKDVRDPRNFSKRRSIKKSSSGSCLRRLDSITEIPKEPINLNLPAIDESRTSIKEETTKQKPKPKLKTKITSSVEVSAPMSPLKFVVENVTVEEKPRLPKKKEIIYSSEVEEVPDTSAIYKDEKNIKKIVTSTVHTENQLPSPEPESGNFWDKIGKRETVYLKKRKQNLDEAREKHKRALFWFPEEEEADNTGDTTPVSKEESNIVLNGSNDIPDQNKINVKVTTVSPVSNKNENISKTQNNPTIHTDVLKNDTENCTPENSMNVITTTPTKNNFVESKETDTTSGAGNKLIPNKSGIDNEASKTDALGECEESMNIGKSASLDTITENKIKVPSQKKTKSEKSKKAQNILDHSEIKPLQALLPKSSAKNKTLEKSNIQLVMGDTAKKLTAAETVVNTADLQEKPKVPCPIHPFGLQKAEESTVRVPSNITENSENDSIYKQNFTEQPKVPVVEPKSVEAESEHTVIESKHKNSKNIKEKDSQVQSKDDETSKETDKVNISTKLESIIKTNSQSDEQRPVEKKITVEKPKLPCPVHPFGIQKVKENTSETNISKTEKYSSIPNIGSTAKSDKLSENEKHNNTTKSANEKVAMSKDSPKSNNVKEVEFKTSSKETSSKGAKKVIGQSSSDLTPIHNNALEKRSPQVKKTDNATTILEEKSKEISSNQLNKIKPETVDPKTQVDPKQPSINKNLKLPHKNLPGGKSKDYNALLDSTNKNNAINEKVLVRKKDSLKSEEASTSSSITTTTQASVPVTLPKSTDVKSTKNSTSHNNEILVVPEKTVVLESQDIPIDKTELKPEISQVKTGEENKADTTQKDQEQEKPKEEVALVSTTKKPVKEEKALRPLIATPRPLQKKAPQVIHSSDSSDSSSEEESSEEEDESDSSEDSTEFFECDNNPDGRTSTGSNDSGFDSSAPASPATFSQIKKGGEASATSSSAAPSQFNNTDILEQELEQSTAYDIFRKTGRFTPPARSIPRFRKYTVEDFQFIKVLGKGSFGKVLLAELRDTEYYYAVKCLKKDVVLEDDDVECTLIERKVLALGTNHPYLCHLFATFQTDSHLFFVMEYLNGGDLMFHIQQSGRFPEARARFYAAEIVSGLKFLHKRGIVYRDLKLDNILLDFEGHVRIADFGMCKLQIYLDKTADTFCGTPDYMAPEIIKGLKYNQTVDWWSFGVLLYEMLIGQSPFSGCDEDELFWSICNEMPSYPRFLSHESLTILTRLLDKDARTRLGGTECVYGDIREQGFFNAIHWDRLERRELEAPFRPRVRHPMDTQYFDRAFTGERPRLTAVEPHVLRSMDQEPFRGFSYTNPNTTDR